MQLIYPDYSLHSQMIVGPVTASTPGPTYPAHIARVDALLNGLMLIPVLVIAAIAGYQKYQSTVLQQRINRLNRLWQSDATSRKLS